MNNKTNLNTRQLTLLMTNLLIAKMMFSFPRFLFKTSGNAAWMQAVYISLFAYIVFSVSVLFYRYTGNKSIIELSENIGKTPFKIFTALLASALIILNISVEMRTFTESVKIVLLPKTNTEFIIILLIVAAIIGARAGLAPLSVINALFFPFCLFFIGFLFIALFPSYNINNLFPIFGTGVRNIFINGIGDMSCFSDLLALNFLLPYFNDTETVRKSGKRAILTGGCVLLLICLAYSLTYPYPYSTEFLLIPYQLSRMVSIGEYFQRFEALFEFFWTITHLLYASIYIFILCDIFKRTFNLRSILPIIPCTAVILALLSVMPGSIVDLLNLAYEIRRKFIPIAYLLPIAIPLIYVLKNRGNLRRY